MNFVRGLRLTIIAAVAILALTTSVIAVTQKGPPGGGGAGGGGQLPPGPPIAVAPASDLAVGETVTLAVPVYNGASYLWQARCVAEMPPEWRTDADWQGSTITDCVGTVGAQEYKVVITSATGQTESSTTVTWHAPNVDIIDGLGANSEGAPPLFINDLCFRQVWRAAPGADRDTGPCFTAFAQEQIRRRNAIGDIVTDTGWNPVAPPNDDSFFFDSPCIKDRKVTNVPAEQWAGIPIGAVFDRFEQRVRLTASECGVAEPLVLTSTWFRLQRRKTGVSTCVIEIQP